VLHVEDALQSTTDLLGTADGEARAAPHTLRNPQVAVYSIDVRVKMFQSYVDTSVQNDIGLRESNCRQSCRNGQREKRFFH
jgi:hypothetical protein